MSRMLDALQNLSAQPATPPVAEEPDVPRTPDPVTPQPTAGGADALDQAERSRRMKELLVKLAPPRPSELLRNLKAEMNGRFGMTVPLAEIRAAPLGSGFPIDLGDDAEPESSIRESISLTFPVSGEPAADPSIAGDMTSLDHVENLLATIEDEAASPGEEIAVSFGGEEAQSLTGSEFRVQERSEVEDQDESIQGSRVGIPDGERREVGDPKSGVGSQEPIAAAEHPHPPAPEVVAGPANPPGNPPPAASEPAAVASPLDHLADPRPLLECQPDEAPPPASAPLTHPPQTISRSKTRLEQRILDDLANASRSAPYRELADRIAQDLRQLSGRCLLFAGVGQASHGDDLLAHLGALMAEEDAEVLLVDANFMRAGLTVGLGALKEAGLGELLEHAGRGDELILPTLLSNVSLLPAGRKALPDSPGVVDQLAQLLVRLQDRFALILIDGGHHTHALSPSLARLCDATYFIVRLGATDASTATTALKAFRGCGARVMGCVATTAAA